MLLINIIKKKLHLTTEIWHARIIQVKLIVYDLYKEERQFNYIILSDGIQYPEVIFSVHQEVKKVHS